MRHSKASLGNALDCSALEAAPSVAKSRKMSKRVRMRRQRSVTPAGPEVKGHSAEPMQTVQWYNNRLVQHHTHNTTG